MEKLKKAINEITRLLAKKKLLRRTELIRALEQTSVALNDDVLKNDALFKTIEASKGNDDSGYQNYVELLIELDHFQKAFLNIESTALKKEGFDHYNRGIIVSKLKSLGTEIRKAKVKKATDVPEQIKKPADGCKQLRTMCEEAKKLIDSLLTELKKEDLQSKRDAQNKLYKILGLTSGCSVIMTNLVLDPSFSNASQASAGFGLLLMEKSIKSWDK